MNKNWQAPSNYQLKLVWATLLLPFPESLLVVGCLPAAPQLLIHSSVAVRQETAEGALARRACEPATRRRSPTRRHASLARRWLTPHLRPPWLLRDGSLGPVGEASGSRNRPQRGVAEPRQRRRTRAKLRCSSPWLNALGPELNPSLDPRFPWPSISRSGRRAWLLRATPARRLHARLGASRRHRAPLQHGV